jgi:hypothetical protein
MSLILRVSRELKTEAEGLRRKISQLDTLERDVETIFCPNVPYPLCVQGVED